MEDGLEEGQIWRWRDFRLLKLLKWEMMNAWTKIMVGVVSEEKSPA